MLISDGLYARFEYGYISYNSGSSQQFNLTQNNNLNFIFGLAEFSMSNGNIFNYNIDLTKANYVTISTTSNFTSFSFNYLTLQFYGCPEEAPFYYNSLCYSFCPSNFYPNLTNANNTCVSCSNPGYHPFLSCT